MTVKKATEKKTVKQKKPVMITTEFKGVFQGDLISYDEASKVAVIKQSRCCVYWSSGVRGFVGLAVNGPDKNCKITPAAPKMTLEKVTSIVEVTPEAVTAWEKEPWA